AMLIPLNQDTMDRHLGRMRAGSSVLYDGDRVKPGAAAEGVQLCPLPLAQLARNILYYNTAAVAAVLRLVGVELKPFEEMLIQQFKRKGDAVVAENVTASRAGYDYAGARFKPYAFSLPDTGKRLAVATGNESLAIGGDDGDPGRLHQRAARRTRDRRSHEDRTRRPLAGARRWAGRLSPHHRRADQHPRLLPPRTGPLQPGRQVPVPRHRARRSARV